MPKTALQKIVFGGIMAVVMVCCMCPLMSLVATIVFKGGFNGQLAATWAQTLALNFPMAFCWQIFVAGPLVRFVFNRFFARRA
jgi:hypothetical protein